MPCIESPVPCEGLVLVQNAFDVTFGLPCEGRVLVRRIGHRIRCDDPVCRRTKAFSAFARVCCTRRSTAPPGCESCPAFFRGKRGASFPAPGEAGMAPALSSGFAGASPASHSSGKPAPPPTRGDLGWPDHRTTPLSGRRSVGLSSVAARASRMTMASLSRRTGTCSLSHRDRVSELSRGEVPRMVSSSNAYCRVARGPGQIHGSLGQSRRQVPATGDP
jgi:hypothetical protein